MFQIGYVNLLKEIIKEIYYSLLKKRKLHIEDMTNEHHQCIESPIVCKENKLKPLNNSCSWKDIATDEKFHV